MLAATIQVNSVLNSSSLSLNISSIASTILMEMCTCSECPSGPSISGLGRRDSGSQEHWTALQGSKKCVGKFISEELSSKSWVYKQAILKHLRYNWQSYNFEKYGLPQEQLPPGQLLLYPIQVSYPLSLQQLYHNFIH